MMHAHDASYVLPGLPAEPNTPRSSPPSRVHPAALQQLGDLVGCYNTQVSALRTLASHCAEHHGSPAWRAEAREAGQQLAGTQGALLELLAVHSGWRALRAQAAAQLQAQAQAQARDASAQGEGQAGGAAQQQAGGGSVNEQASAPAVPSTQVTTPATRGSPPTEQANARGSTTTTTPQSSSEAPAAGQGSPVQVVRDLGVAVVVTRGMSEEAKALLRSLREGEAGLVRAHDTLATFLDNEGAPWLVLHWERDGVRGDPGLQGRVEALGMGVGQGQQQGPRETAGRASRRSSSSRRRSVG